MNGDSARLNQFVREAKAWPFKEARDLAKRLEKHGGGALGQGRWWYVGMGAGAGATHLARQGEDGDDRNTENQPDGAPRAQGRSHAGVRLLDRVPGVPPDPRSPFPLDRLFGAE